MNDELNMLDVNYNKEEKKEIISETRKRIVESNVQLLLCLNMLDIPEQSDEVKSVIEACIVFNDVNNGLTASGYMEDSEEYLDMKDIIEGLIVTAVTLSI